MIYIRWPLFRKRCLLGISIGIPNDFTIGVRIGDCIVQTPEGDVESIMFCIFALFLTVEFLVKGVQMREH